MEYYPLLFEPIIKERIWGGIKLNTMLGKPLHEPPVGECWELSGVSGDVSVVANGPLQGTALTELIHHDPIALLGKKVMSRFGEEFPILIKFIDAEKDLSIQVHPDDGLAAQRHGSKGKNEMWYIMDADLDARLILGFKHSVDQATYASHLKSKTLMEIMHNQPVKKGEVYFIKAGTVHAIGGGILLAEIQQTSDVTYRVYDYDRVGADGKTRELHTELALDAMDLAPADGAQITYSREPNRSNPVVRSPFFNTNYLSVTEPKQLDLHHPDAFTILMCVSGSVGLDSGSDSIVLSCGMTTLLPASLKEVFITGEGELLEITV